MRPQALRIQSAPSLPFVKYGVIDSSLWSGGRREFLGLSLPRLG